MFSTQFGLKYVVGFVEDYMLSDDGLVYQLFIDNVEGVHQPIDRNIYLTVVAILEEFFTNENAAIVYICDTSDGLQAVRQRLFRIWFDNYPNNHSYRLTSKTLTVDATSYYVSLLARVDMPLLGDRIEALNKLHKILERK